MHKDSEFFVESLTLTHHCNEDIPDEIIFSMKITGRYRPVIALNRFYISAASGWKVFL